MTEVHDVSLGIRAPENDILRAAQAALAERQRSVAGAQPWLVTSRFSKAVAARVAPNAPLAGYLKSLLTGNYRAAAQIAWQRARAAADERERGNWIDGVALAVTCQDRAATDRADEFLAWSKKKPGQAGNRQRQTR